VLQVIGAGGFAGASTEGQKFRSRRQDQAVAALLLLRASDPSLKFQRL